MTGGNRAGTEPAPAVTVSAQAGTEPRPPSRPPPCQVGPGGGDGKDGVRAGRRASRGGLGREGEGPQSGAMQWGGDEGLTEQALVGTEQAPTGTKQAPHRAATGATASSSGFSKSGTDDSANHEQNKGGERGLGFRAVRVQGPLEGRGAGGDEGRRRSCGSAPCLPHTGEISSMQLVCSIENSCRAIPLRPAGNRKNTAARLVAVPSIETRAKHEVEMRRILVIANLQIQSLISVSWLP